MTPALTIGLALTLVVLAWLAGTYNRFVRLRQLLRDSWADIDVELKRRHDLIPNLVEVVRGYTQYEQGVLERVIQLRNSASGEQDRRRLADQETALMRGMKELFAIVENYPDLKANRRYAALQRELANTEDRIAAARRFYNGNVRDFVVLRDSVPSTVIASMTGFKSLDPQYFEIADDAERVVPRVGEGG